MKEVYAIFDRRLNAYMTPFFAANDAVAYRTFSASVLYHETPMQQFPADFELHGIGRFDDLTGQFKNVGAAQVLVSARAVIEELHEEARENLVDKDANASGDKVGTEGM